MRRLLLAVVALGILAGGAFAATTVRWGGGLGGHYPSFGVGTPVRVGAPFSIGVTELHPGNRAVIESVRLHDATPGLVFVGALVYPSGHGEAGSERRFPPTWPHVAMRTANGVVLHAHETLLLAVGLRMTHPGPFRVKGFDLLYRERWHGIDLRHQAHIGPEVVGCATRSAAKVPNCKMPQLSP